MSRHIPGKDKMQHQKIPAGAWAKRILSALFAVVLLCGGGAMASPVSASAGYPVYFAAPESWSSSTIHMSGRQGEGEWTTWEMTKSDEKAYSSGENTYQIWKAEIEESYEEFSEIQFQRYEEDALTAQYHLSGNLVRSSVEGMLWVPDTVEGDGDLDSSGNWVAYIPDNTPKASATTTDDENAKAGEVSNPDKIVPSAADSELLSITPLAAGSFPDTLYLDIGSIDWGKDGARIVLAYKSTDNGNGYFAQMTHKSGTIYEIVLPENMDTANSEFKFVRMNSTGDFGWDIKWNEAPSGNLTLQQDKNCYNLTDWDSGEWANDWYTPSSGSSTITLTLYLDTSGLASWRDDGAVSGLRYYSNQAQKTVPLTQTADNSSIYTVTVNDVDSGSKLQFIRAQSSDWSTIWNYTAELEQPEEGKNCYHLTGWTGNENKTADGNWDSTPSSGSSTITLTLYLDTSGLANWRDADAVSGLLYSSNQVQKTAWLTQAEGTGDLYTVTINDLDSGSKLKFFRANPNNRDEIWNYTAELDQPEEGKNCYHLTGWTGNENKTADGNWDSTPSSGSSVITLTLYLDTSGLANWRDADAVSGLLYSSNQEQKTAWLTQSADNSSLYTVTINDLDSGSKLKFFRANPNKRDEIWNYTAELDQPEEGKNCYHLTGWTDNENKTADGNWDSTPSSGGEDTGETRTVYYDATFSKLSYQGSTDNGTNTIPMANGNGEGDKVYCHWWIGTSSGNVEMTRGEGDVYQADIPKNAASVLFYSSSDGSVPGSGSGKTENLTIPANLERPCFYGDTSDSAIYDNSSRSGYWAELGTVRDAQSGKKQDAVNIASGTFSAQKDTLYLKTTLYDYYSDYELNGSNRDSYPSGYNSSQRDLVNFRQLDQALSDYYSGNSVTYPLYVGHFQPDVGWTQFSGVASTLNLYGHTDYNKFFSINNSIRNRYGNEQFLDYATQGLVNGSLSSGALCTSSGASFPLFNKAFLRGDNSKNAVLGEVYEQVLFPFTKQDINGNGIKYWVFDSSQTTLAMRQDSSRGYFLTDVGNQEWSKNRETDGSSRGNGFFPLNDASCTDVNKYNYGFGTRIDLTFRLTETGTVRDNDGNAQPIEFNFSGDDDVWVFIDGMLALDMGGDHSQTNGKLNFATMEATVSKVKAGGSVSGDYGSGKTDSFTISGSKTDEHTLTMFVMERGMWGSNMKITFNFPDENQFEVQTHVDTTGVNKLFQDNFSSQSFDFLIQNQVTHYGAKAVGGNTSFGFIEDQRDIPDYGSATSGKLEIPTGAKYAYVGNSDTAYSIGSDGKFALTDGKTATFHDQFRRGSYLYLEEQVTEAQKKLFDTTWTMYANDAAVSYFGTGGTVQNPTGVSLKDVASYTINDGRTEKITTADQQAGNNYNGSRPTADSIVFRSYAAPDNENISTKLKAVFTNTVNTGSLVVKKETAEGSSPLTGEYRFYVEYYNIGGVNAGPTRSETFTLKAGETHTVTGIPVGTQFRIYEQKDTDTSLESVQTFVQKDEQPKAAEIKEGIFADAACRYVEGAIETRDTTTTYTFYNTGNRTIDVTKLWRNADGTELGNPPESVSAQLQRSTDGDVWESVKDSDMTLSAESEWKGTFKPQPVRSEPDETGEAGAAYQYRVVELNGGTPLAAGDTLTVDGVRYTVSHSASEDGGSWTITNTAVASVTLHLTKQSSADGSKLSGVTFRLEKLDGENVDASFPAQSATTGEDGTLDFTGIYPGTYRLTETQAAANYSLLSESIRIVIGDDYSVKVNGTVMERSDLSGSAYTVELTVQNQPILAMPPTGGGGFGFWILGGLCVVAVSLLGFILALPKEGGKRYHR